MNKLLQSDIHLEYILFYFLSTLEKRKIRHALAVTTILFFSIASAAMIYRKDHVNKRHQFYQDFYLAKIQLPERSTVSICPPERVVDDWVFAIDMQRFYKVSLTAEMGHDYLIVDKNSKCRVPQGYQKAYRQPTLKYVLYKQSAAK